MYTPGDANNNEAEIRDIEDYLSMELSGFHDYNFFAILKQLLLNPILKLIRKGNET